MTKKNEESFDPLAGYNPTKPLLIEPPIGYLERDTLSFVAEESNIDQYYFDPALPLEEKEYKIVFKTSLTEKKLKTLDFVPSYLDGEIVNQKVLDILYQYCPGDFQIAPVTIKSKSNNPEKQFENYDYYFLHIIKKLPFIDFKNSEFILIDNEKGNVLGNMITVRRKIRFKELCEQDFYIARDQTFPRCAQVISQKFYKILKPYNLSGVIFLPDWLSKFERKRGSLPS